MQHKLHLFTTLHRKVVLALAMALCLVFTFAFGASAHTTPAPHKVHPLSTGGGCGNFYNSNRNDISVSSCINYNGWTGELNGDAYVTFRPNFSLGYIEGCYVQILIISNHGQYPGAFLQQNCFNAASNGESDAHFGVVSTTAWNYGDYANTVVNVKLTYSSGSYSVVNNALSRRIYL